MLHNVSRMGHLMTIFIYHLKTTDINRDDIIQRHSNLHTMQSVYPQGQKYYFIAKLHYILSEDTHISVNHYTDWELIYILPYSVKIADIVNLQMISNLEVVTYKLKVVIT